MGAVHEKCFRLPVRPLEALQGEFKNCRKSRSRRGNEAEVFSAPKSASYSGNEIKGNARPHPGPLPQEREKLPRHSGIFMLSGAALPHGDLRRRLPFLNIPWLLRHAANENLQIAGREPRMVPAM